MRLLLPICVVVSFVGVVAASAAGCSGVALPPGAESVPAGGSIPQAPPSACSQDGTYYVVPAADCGFADCNTATQPKAYALCDGTSFSSCTCTKPGAGWTQVGSYDFGPPDAGSFFPDVGTAPDQTAPPKDSTVPTDSGPPDDGGDGSMSVGDTGPG
jgi:hypothetical protein